MKIHSTTRRLARNAFTLMEMMLVLAIIALLIAVGAVTLTNVQESAEITTAQAQISTIKTAMISYKNHNRSFPGKLEDLVTPPANARIKRRYIEETGIRDPWGELYQLRVPGKKAGEAYEIYSMGPDKKDGTQDDVYP
jgi:general secretion pathway protein G